MAKTSIHIKPCQSDPTRHNVSATRRQELEYVRADLTAQNSSVILQEYSQVVASIKEKYATRGVHLQKKATPIREGVVVIKPDTTLEDLKRFARECERCFGIRCFQIAIHRDEGHWTLNQETLKQEWRPNYHAHMVFDWTRKFEPGDKSKRIIQRIDRAGMRQMQSILSQCIGMERGESSSKKHVNALVYKQRKITEELEEYDKVEEYVMGLCEEGEKIRRSNKIAKDNFITKSQIWLAEHMHSKQYEEIIETQSATISELSEDVDALSKQVTTQNETIKTLNAKILSQQKSIQEKGDKITVLENESKQKDEAHLDEIHNLTGSLIDLDNDAVDSVIKKHCPAMDIVKRRIARRQWRASHPDGVRHRTSSGIRQ